MNVESNYIRNMMIGLNNSAIKIEYGGWLKLGFGEKVFYDKIKLKGKYLFELNVSSINSAWRIIKDEQLLCGSDNEIEYCNETISKLNLGKVIDFIELSKFDLRIIFDSGVVIDYFCQSTDGTNLLILDYKNHKSYEFFYDGWEQTDANEVTHKLTKIEEILNLLSEDFQSRWQNIIPDKEDENECRHCFYFRGLNGHFYFWDYGICSNSESKNDGKLVNVESGCSKLKQLKELI